MVADTATTQVLDRAGTHPGGDFASIPTRLHDSILSDLCDPDASIASVARGHGITVAQLALWLTEPKTREKMLRIEKAGYAHTRMAASITLSSTVHVLCTILDDYREARVRAKQVASHESTPPSPKIDPAGTLRSLPPADALDADSKLSQRLELRRADGARRAAYQLYRLSRIVPIDDTRLAPARPVRTTQAAADLVPPPRPSDPNSSLSSPLRRTDRCHALQCVESGSIHTSSRSSPPAGRTIDRAEACEDAARHPSAPFLTSASRRPSAPAHASPLSSAARRPESPLTTPSPAARLARSAGASPLPRGSSP